jgi:hypothetical protein
MLRLLAVQFRRVGDVKAVIGRRDPVYNYPEANDVKV